MTDKLSELKFRVNAVVELGASADNADLVSTVCKSLGEIFLNSARSGFVIS